MNKKLKRKWCSSLRGGTWNQIKGQYNDTERGRCALGVLMEIARAERGSSYEGFGNWSEGKIKAEDIRKITTMNDLEGMSFLDIADWIEKNV